MKLSSAIILSLLAFKSIAADTTSVGKKLASYPDNFTGDSPGKCESVIGVADLMGNMRQKIPSVADAKARLLKAVKSGEVPADFEDPFLFIMEMAYSQEHVDKSTDKFVEDVEHMCKMPEVRLCDEVINAAVYVSELKSEGGTNTGLARQTYREKGFSWLHFELLDMLFWPEHTAKTTQEFADFVANEWCAKYSTRERTEMYDARQEQLGL